GSQGREPRERSGSTCVRREAGGRDGRSGRWRWSWRPPSLEVAGGWAGSERAACLTWSRLRWPVNRPTAEADAQATPPAASSKRGPEMNANHVGIVWNPSKTEKADLEAALPTQTGVDITWHETEEDDPGKSATQAALDAGAEVIIAAGGDGTVRAIAGHLAEIGSSAELGIVPLGTGNLLARNLDVPLNSLGEAMDRAFNGTAREIDMGWVEVTLPQGMNREPFVVMAGFGIDA